LTTSPKRKGEGKGESTKSTPEARYGGAKFSTTKR